MKVLALTPNILGFSPGQRSSIELWEKVLDRQGIRVDYLPFETPGLHRVLYKPGHLTLKLQEMVRAYCRHLLQLKRVHGYDAVFVYREAALIGPALIERLVARRGKPIIYQLDDPLYIPYRSPNNGLLSYLKFFKKVDTISRLSKVVIVNSTHHREYVSRFNSNIWQIPSVVDTERYRYERRDRATPPVVGWSGSPTTVKNVSMISDALLELSKQCSYELVLIGGTRFEIPVSHTAQSWREETEVGDLRRMDVGLVPVPDNEWNRRKFFMKVVQYMALGIPPVATPTGSNPEVIEHGRTGFLAGTPEEWVKYLKLLIKDRALLDEMSANAAAVARERYSLQANEEAIVSAFRAALN